MSMARFRFRLESVLTHRRAVERDRQRAVAALERRRAELEAEIMRRRHAAVGEQTLARASLVGVLDVRALRLQGAAALRHEAEARRAAIELAGVLQRLEAARADLLHASRRRKAVEMLRERRWEQWRLDQSRAEAAALDELVVMGAGRTDQGGRQ